ncbi:MAG TPA: four helix bundle protein [Bacteroidales bacterium]|nr:four helix bundle protein [Bacteroidales bacterium]
MEHQNYIELKDLEVYRLSRRLSKTAWEIFCRLNTTDKKHIGDQFLRSVDSIGANIAEGYGRFYYMDKVRFYYNSRASHFEAFTHWLELMSEREIILPTEYESISQEAVKLQIKLNNFISSTAKNAKKIRQNESQ